MNLIFLKILISLALYQPRSMNFELSFVLLLARLCTDISTRCRVSVFHSAFTPISTWLFQRQRGVVKLYFLSYAF